MNNLCPSPTHVSREDLGELQSLYQVENVINVIREKFNHLLQHLHYKEIKHVQETKKLEDEISALKERLSQLERESSQSDAQKVS